MTKKSLTIISIVLVAVIATTTFLTSGTFLKGKLELNNVPWWCVKPTYGSTESTYTPKIITESDSKKIPGILKAIKDLIPSEDATKTSTPGGQSRSGGNSGQETVAPGNIIPPISIGTLPINFGDNNTDTNTSEKIDETKAKEGYWSYQLKCPEGYNVNYKDIDPGCKRIKKMLEKGTYTEATLPSDLQKYLRVCKRYGSWFTITMSENECYDYMKQKALYPSKTSYTKDEYCTEMYQKTSQKAWNDLYDLCKKKVLQGLKLTPEQENFCKKTTWWTTVTEDQCKKIGNEMNKLKTLLGEQEGNGELCTMIGQSEEQIGKTIHTCADLYPNYVSGGCGGGGF